MAKLNFAAERCKGCALCVNICPKKIIIMDTETLNSAGYSPAGVSDSDMEQCISCAMCAKMCPDCVIRVEK